MRIPLVTSREGRAELGLLLRIYRQRNKFFAIAATRSPSKIVLEEILRRKQERRDYTLRVWSAGLLRGQSPTPSPF